MNITALLEYEEGFKSRPYRCSEGYPTVGYGFKIGDLGAPLPSFYLPRSAADVWLAELIAGTRIEIMKSPSVAAAFKACAGCEAREAVLLSMAYQMGVPKLAGFTKTLALIATGWWRTASEEMLNSRWARQTPERAARHSQQLLSGDWCPLYTAV